MSLVLIYSQYFTADQAAIQCLPIIIFIELKPVHLVGHTEFQNEIQNTVPEIVEVKLL